MDVNRIQFTFSFTFLSFISRLLTDWTCLTHNRKKCEMEGDICGYNKNL